MAVELRPEGEHETLWWKRAVHVLVTVEPQCGDRKGLEAVLRREQSWALGGGVGEGGWC